MSAFVVVIDVPTSWETYQRVAEELGDDAPEGLVVHTAGPTETGFRIVDVWSSERAFQAFQGDRLGPAVARHAGAEPPTPTIQTLHAEHVLEATARSRAVA